MAIKSVVPSDQLMVITRNGVVNRQRVDEIRVIGRATQGVRLVNLDDGDQVMDVARIIPDNGDNGIDELPGDFAVESASEGAATATDTGDGADE